MAHKTRVAAFSFHIGTRSLYRRQSEFVGDAPLAVQEELKARLQAGAPVGLPENASARSRGLLIWLRAAPEDFPLSKSRSETRALPRVG